MKNILKIIILLILSTFLSTVLFAQKNNSFAGIRLGYALPMGQFASHEYGTGGYALIGMSVGV